MDLMFAAINELGVLRIIFGISILILFARIFYSIFSRFKIPGVIGEIIAGIVFGPYALGSIIQIGGQPLIDFNSLFLTLSLVSGIIVLLDVGLTFEIRELLKTSFRGFIIAVSGVVLPFITGYYLAVFMGFGDISALVIGASLTATSIAITYEVLKEFRKHKTLEAKVIISAAIIDDILGIIILSIVLSVTQGAILSVQSIIFQVVSIFSIWIVITAAAVLLVPRIIHLLAKPLHSLEALVVLITFGLATITSALGLSPIVGAFIAGTSLAETRHKKEIKDFVSKLMIVFGPLFFAVIGTYFSPVSISFYGILVILLIVGVAVLSKYIGCFVPTYYFYGNSDVANKVGLGMVSRGEIGFIIIGIALTLEIIPSNIYSIILIALLATSIISPILLRVTYFRKKRKRSR